MGLIKKVETHKFHKQIWTPITKIFKKIPLFRVQKLIFGQRQNFKFEKIRF